MYDIVIVNRKVVAIHHGGSTPIPEAGFVLRTSVKTDSLDVSYTGMPDIQFALQVGPVLVQNGKAARQFDTPFYSGTGPMYPPTVYPLDWAKARAPRIGFGSKKGEPVLLWASGTNRFFYKQGENPCGASLQEFADFCAAQHLDECINLDGGGSSQIVCNGKRTLKLADHYADLREAERPVPLGLAIQA